MIALHPTVSFFAITVFAEPSCLLIKIEFHLFFSEPAKIIETNMNVSRTIPAEAGTDLLMFCKAEGNPVPSITWFKVSRM
jgi:hypothetical protein